MFLTDKQCDQIIYYYEDIVGMLEENAMMSWDMKKNRLPINERKPTRRGWYFGEEERLEEPIIERNVKRVSNRKHRMRKLKHDISIAFYLLKSQFNLGPNIGLNRGLILSRNEVNYNDVNLLDELCRMIVNIMKQVLVNQYVERNLSSYFNTVYHCLDSIENYLYYGKRLPDCTEGHLYQIYAPEFEECGENVPRKDLKTFNCAVKILKQYYKELEMGKPLFWLSEDRKTSKKNNIKEEKLESLHCRFVDIFEALEKKIVLRKGFGCMKRSIAEGYFGKNNLVILCQWEFGYWKYCL